MRTKAGISGIPLSPTLTPSMRAGPENMEGRSPCRENNDSLPIQIPRPGDTHFVQFKEEKLIQLGHFFFWRETEISFITKILAADGLRSHVTITLPDKSRYDLILKRNSITSAGWIDFFHQESKVKVSVLFTENR